MKLKSIKFILNNEVIGIHEHPTVLLLDFLRNQKGLKGTKEGCREGDCGACTVLLGELKKDKLKYKTVTSCLLPLGSLNDKHIVTIEGINQKKLTPVQNAIVEHGATQCGYCTPGIVISLTGFLLKSKNLTHEEAVSSIDGNICRCTGYTSIKKTALHLSDMFFKRLRKSDNRINTLVKLNVLPDYFLDIPKKLLYLRSQIKNSNNNIKRDSIIVAGGTDLFIQKPDNLNSKQLIFLSNKKSDSNIWKDKNYCYIDASCSVSEISESPIIKRNFPKINEWIRLISSTQIRNLATIGGNIVNASPIADLVILLLSWDAKLTLLYRNSYKTLPLHEFYKGYKITSLRKGEIIENIFFPLSVKDVFYNFEKVSKRINLDIASVNSAIQIQVKQMVIKKIILSAGGVAPIPKFLIKTSDYLNGKNLTAENIIDAIEIMKSEITPISDIRGTAKYKTILLRNLIIAHFLKLFPDVFTIENFL